MDKGVLYLIPTFLAPNTADYILSPQIKEIISKTDLFFTENIRTTRRFISELKLGIKIDELSFVVLDKDTPVKSVEEYLELVEKGRDAGVLSEAGCPGIADPGSIAVNLAHKKGIKVVPLAGPSAILLALMGSGFSGQSFVFHGYLPIEKESKVKVIKELEKDAFNKNQTQIFMETPFRNNQLLQELLNTCKPETLLCIASNLTDKDEFLKTLPIQKWKTQVPDLHKKPTVFCLFHP